MKESWNQKKTTVRLLDQLTSIAVKQCWCITDARLLTFSSKVGKNVHRIYQLFDISKILFEAFETNESEDIVKDKRKKEEWQHCFSLL